MAPDPIGPRPGPGPGPGPGIIPPNPVPPLGIPDPPVKDPRPDELPEGEPVEPPDREEELPQPPDRSGGPSTASRRPP